MRRLLFRLWMQWRHWWASRDYRLFVSAAPALLVGGGVVAFSLIGLMPLDHEILARYLERATDALRIEDYATALTCYDRLAAQGGQRPEFFYGLAKCAEALQQGDRVHLILRELAPPDKQGFGPAHLWVARLLLRGPANAHARMNAKVHLLRALDGGVDDKTLAHGLLGELYLAENQLDLAETHLKRAVRERPQLRLRLALVYAIRGDRDRARSEAQLAVNAFRERSKHDLYNHAARLTWADAVTFLEDFPEAIRILEEGLTLTKESAYRVALAKVYATWADVQARHEKPAPDQAKALAMIEKGLRYDPTNQALLDRLLAALRVGGDGGNRARSALHTLLASGSEATGTLHFVLGVDSWQRGLHKEARVHWERALELTPHLPIIANNLAWLLATNDPPDLPRALELATKAVAAAPGSAGFRDTRGQILVKMKRWPEALADLEAALPAMRNDPQLHVALAEVYEQLGNAAVAAEHRRLADKHKRGSNHQKKQ